MGPKITTWDQNRLHLDKKSQKSLHSVVLKISVTRSGRQALTGDQMSSFVVVLCVLTLLLWWFQDYSFWKSLLYALRYTGALMIAIAPLYAVAVNDYKRAIAAVLSGILSIASSSFFIWEMKRNRED